MSGPAAARLPDGRLHFQHGPIDLILQAHGPAKEVAAAYRQAWAAFRPVLDDLVAQLPTLRTPVTDLLSARPHLARQVTLPTNAAQASVLHKRRPIRSSGRDRAMPCRPRAPQRIDINSDHEHHPLPSWGKDGEAETASPPGAKQVAEPNVTPRTDAAPRVLGGQPASGDTCASAGGTPPALFPASPAEAMIRAASRHAPAFVTPMAAVAGAVADHVLAAMTAGRALQRAYVNNGGDVALWLAPGEAITAAGGPALADRIRITAESAARGIATSGWRGRSHSLGIADAVTVLARTAAEADVAATLLASAVDLPGHPAVSRRPARELAPDSDLGSRPVTVAVGPLPPADTARALAAGRAAAEGMRRAGLIAAAALWLGDACVTAGAARGEAAQRSPQWPAFSRGKSY